KHGLRYSSDERPDITSRIPLACWCPGAESNHRHGDFQSPESRREERGSVWGRPSSTLQDLSRQVRRSTVMHGSSANSTAAGDKLTMETMDVPEQANDWAEIGRASCRERRSE